MTELQPATDREQRERELVARVVAALGRDDLAQDFRLGRLNLPLLEDDQ